MKIAVIALRELKSSFVTPVGYVLLAGFMLSSGYWFFNFVQRFNLRQAQSAIVPNLSTSMNTEVIEPFYHSITVMLIFLIPLLTMRAFAEEKRNGTYEFLMTSPVTVLELVLGKFFGACAVCGAMLISVLIFPGMLLYFFDPELLPALIGALGLFLFSFSFIAVGVAVSAVSSSQLASGVASMMLLLVFYVIDASASRFGDAGRALLLYLAPVNHTEVLFRGVLRGQDLTYFVSLTLLGLFVAARVLDTQRWR